MIFLLLFLLILLLTPARLCPGFLAECEQAALCQEITNDVVQRPILCFANEPMVVLVVRLVVFMLSTKGLQMITHLIITAIIILITTLILILSLLLHRIVVSVSKVVDFPVGGMLFLLLVV